MQSESWIIERQGLSLLTLISPPREPDCIPTRLEFGKLNKKLGDSRTARAVIINTWSNRYRVQVCSDMDNITLVAPATPTINIRLNLL
jgi:hypothetical protein